MVRSPEAWLKQIRWAIALTPESRGHCPRSNPAHTCSTKIPPLHQCQLAPCHVKRLIRSGGEVKMGFPEYCGEATQSNESCEREHPWNSASAILTMLWVHNKIPQSTVKPTLPSNWERTSCNRTLATVPWVALRGCSMKDSQSLALQQLQIFVAQSVPQSVQFGGEHFDWQGLWEFLNSKKWSTLQGTKSLQCRITEKDYSGSSPLATGLSCLETFDMVHSLS